jgi:hypothetical protein
MDGLFLFVRVIGLFSGLGSRKTSGRKHDTKKVQGFGTPAVFYVMKAQRQLRAKTPNQAKR